MLLLVASLLASMVIAGIRLTTTPDETIGVGFHGLPRSFVESHRAEYGRGKPAEP